MSKEASNKGDGKVYLKDWRTSTAKQCLKTLMEEGQITEETDQNHIYDNMCNGIFQNYKRANFKTNLKNLIGSVNATKKCVVRDEAAFQNDLSLVGRPSACANGGPIWHTSRACVMLEDDVRNGRHQGIDPTDLRLSNIEYKKFGLKTFKEHLRQTERKFRGRGYWYSKGEEKKKREEELQRALQSLNINVPGQF